MYLFLAFCGLEVKERDESKGEHEIYLTVNLNPDTTDQIFEIGDPNF